MSRPHLIQGIYGMAQQERVGQSIAMISADLGSKLVLARGAARYYTSSYCNALQMASKAETRIS